jgi:hypothetical protein
MARTLVVGIAEADDFATRRATLIDLIQGLVTLGVEVKIVWLGEGPVPDELWALGEVGTLPPTTPRSAQRLAGAVARRVGSDLGDTVHDLQARKDLAWLGDPDALHLSGVRAVRLLHHLRHRSLPVVTWVHPHDFSIAGLSPADRDVLRARTRRFLLADGATGADLLEAGVPADRLERAPSTVRFPRRPPTSDQRRQRRAAEGLPADRAVVAVAPVPDWFEAPDLTVSLAWELRQRRGRDAPHLYWYGMPSHGEARWALDADLARLGLDHVHVVTEVPSTEDLVAFADVVVVPSRPEAPAGTPDFAVLRDHLLPVLCWHDSSVADEAARWPGPLVPYPEVGAMADAVLDLVEDTPERHRARNVRWRSLMAEVEQFAPLEVPAP